MNYCPGYLQFLFGNLQTGLYEVIFCLLAPSSCTFRHIWPGLPRRWLETTEMIWIVVQVCAAAGGTKSWLMA
jgi:hypothetical protein